MASIKWSALVSEVKGVLNGSILSVGNAGQTIRNRTTGNRANTSRWSAVKIRLSYVSSQWRSLTSGQQAAWTAAGVGYPYTDKFGNSQTPSGFQLYCTLNINRLILGQSLLSTPSAPPSQESISPVEVNYANPTTLSLEFNNTLGNASYLQIFASAPVSKGVTSLPQNLRQIYSVITSTSNPIDIWSSYTAAYYTPPANSRIWFKYLQIDSNTGAAYGEGVYFTDI